MLSEQELLEQIARLNATVETLTTKSAEKDATIAQLEQKYSRLMRLEVAARMLGLNYEVARRWCADGCVTTAEKQGGFWLVNMENLKAVAAQRNVHTRSAS
jgi:hypothetical protein